MESSTIISFPVPDEGFPEMSLPVVPDLRLSKDDVKIEYCGPQDLVEWSLVMYEAFPKAFWEAIETKDEQYSIPFRAKTMAKRWLPWLSQPGFHCIKAVHRRTGEIMGVAGWYENGPHAVYPTSYALYPDVEFPPWFVPCAWREDLITSSSSSGGGDVLGIVKRMGWTAEDLEEMKAFHSKGYTDEFDGHDIGRLQELGHRPHWCLAPMAVWPKWRRRGVGSALMQWGLEKADHNGWPVILDAAPNARPVYYRYGFVPTGRKDGQLLRPGKKV